MLVEDVFLPSGCPRSISVNCTGDSFIWSTGREDIMQHHAGFTPSNFTWRSGFRRIAGLCEVLPGKIKCFFFTLLFIKLKLMTFAAESPGICQSYCHVIVGYYRLSETLSCCLKASGTTWTSLDRRGRGGGSREMVEDGGKVVRVCVFFS